MIHSAIVRIEEDAARKAPVERPLDLACSGMSNPHICLEAVLSSAWDDPWADRIRALSAKELNLLHRQYLRGCADTLANKVIKSDMMMGMHACSRMPLLHAWNS